MKTSIENGGLSCGDSPGIGGCGHLRQVMNKIGALDKKEVANEPKILNGTSDGRKKRKKFYSRTFSEIIVDNPVTRLSPMAEEALKNKKNKEK